MVKYSVEKDPEKTARAYGHEFRCSPKDSKNIAKAIKGMKVKDAKTYLENVMAKKQAVPYVYHHRKRAHRKGLNGPGGYPEKAAGYMLKVIKNAENNAEYKGLDGENMVISHLSTYKGRETEGVMPRAQGRATAKNEQTTNIEMIIEEAE